MDRKTVSILAVVVAVILCACPGLTSLCLSLSLFSADPNSFIIDGAPVQSMPALIGMLMICAGFIGLLVPVGLGFLLFRRPQPRPAPTGLDEPLPPAI
jgi:hypothetical protein